VDGASVMDEHVNPVMGGAEVAGEGMDRIEVLQIGQAVADAGAAGRRGDAAPGQRDGGRIPDPGGRAGNEDGPPVEAPGTASRAEAAAGADRAGIQLLPGEHSRSPFAPHC